MSRRTRRRRKGFTLIELIIVTSVLVFLATISVVGYTQIRKGLNEDATRALIDQTESAVKLYQANMNRFPTTEEGLQALIDEPEEEAEAEKWRGPYLEEREIPRDPWGNELQYELVEESGSGSASGETFHIWSYGPDGEDDTEDDIRNWKEER